MIPKVLLDGGVIEELDELYKMIAELKQENHRLTSNMYLLETNIQGLIDQGRLFYEYQPREYLNLWYIERDFVRLYFYIANREKYKSPTSHMNIICDLFFTKENEDSNKVIGLIRKNGFNEYALYHKWFKTDKTENFSNKINLTNFFIYSENANGFLEAIKKYFDVFCDFVPEDDSAGRFFENKTCYSVLLKGTNQLVGGIVITAHGKVQTEEFIFVDKDYNGQGIASLLHEYWYEKSETECCKYIAWIRDGNEASRRLHLKFGYHMQKALKITMIRKGV